MPHDEVKANDQGNGARGQGDGAAHDGEDVLKTDADERDREV
jgi:hypothetical protein